MKVRVVPTEVFSRVVGYYRPIQNWHKGKVAEFNLRKTIDPPENMEEVEKVEEESVKEEKDNERIKSV